MADLKPPFTKETAQKKVKAAQDMWNTRYVSDFLSLRPLADHVFKRRALKVSSLAFLPTCIVCLCASEHMRAYLKREGIIFLEMDSLRFALRE